MFYDITQFKPGDLVQCRKSVFNIYKFYLNGVCYVIY